MNTLNIAARVASAAAITYQALLVLLIFLRPDLDPSWHTLSEWAIGRHGWVMTSAFLISGASYGALLAVVRRELHGVPGKIGLALLLVCTIDELVSASELLKAARHEALALAGVGRTDLATKSAFNQS